MTWIIDRIAPTEESVYLQSSKSGITRKISVPGALSAHMDSGVLVIGTKTGHVWYVDPDTGARRRRTEP